MKGKGTFTINEKIRELAPMAEAMPSVVIVQQLEPFVSIFMSSRGLMELGISQEELLNMGPEYLGKFFHLEDSVDYLEKLKTLLNNNDESQTFTFFQQVKFKGREDLIWHVGSTKIFHKNKVGKPTHIITIAIPIDRLAHIRNKAERLLAERNFFKENLRKFLTLGRREREVLQLVATGKSSSEIASDLGISVQTVNTHRKTIKQKLSITSGYDFTCYAQSFDLI